MPRKPQNAIDGPQFLRVYPWRLFPAATDGARLAAWINGGRVAVVHQPRDAPRYGCERQGVVLYALTKAALTEAAKAVGVLAVGRAYKSAPYPNVQLIGRPRDLAVALCKRGDK